MPKTSIAARFVPVAAATAVLAASLLIRPVSVSAVNTTLCGSAGYGYGANPAIDKVSPNVGTTLGVDPVILTGCGFTGFTSPISVNFGSAASTSLTIDSDTQITAESPPHAAGTVDVSVTTPFGTSPSQPGDSFTYVAPNRCTWVTLTAAPPNQTTSGTQVTFTANATGCPNATSLYEFWIRPFSSNTWTSVQAYSSNNVFLWDTSRQEPSYIGVWAKDAGSPTATFEVNASVQYMVTVAECGGGVTLAAAPTPPQNAGTQVTFTATASGCPNANPLYEFWERPAASSTWTSVQAYSTNNQFRWDTSGAAGIVYIGVWAKDAASTTPTFDPSCLPCLKAIASVAYQVNSGSCSAVSLTAAPPSPQVAGTQVTFTAHATGCTNSLPLYAFWKRRVSSSVWTLAQNYSGSDQFHWDTTSDSGAFQVGVWAKDAASTTPTFDANASVPYAALSSCASVTVSASPNTVTHGTGTHSTATAAASGCTNISGTLYEFWMRTTTTGWQLVQGYSTSSIYDWNSTGAPITTVYFGVWVKDAQSSTSTFDANASTTLAVT